MQADLESPGAEVSQLVFDRSDEGIGRCSGDHLQFGDIREDDESGAVPLEDVPQPLRRLEDLLPEGAAAVAVDLVVDGEHALDHGAVSPVSRKVARARSIQAWDHRMNEALTVDLGRL